MKAAPAADRRLLVSPANSESEGLELELWRLAPGGRLTAAAEPKETVAVVLSGEVELVAGHGSWRLGGRADVFSGVAAAIYAPAGAEVAAASEAGAEVALIRVPAEAGLEAFAIQPAEVRVETRGEGTWLREVHTILDVDRPARRLIVGETFNPQGGWSSYPPHKHDRQAPPEETRLQEVYHYRFQPAQGFGLQRIYSPERGTDEVLVVENGDSVLIPYGYHPVVSAPGYRLYYLWALAGDSREMRLREDPDHVWVRHGG